MGSFNIFCEALRVRWRLVENVSFILLSCHRRATRATTTNTRPKALLLPKRRVNGLQLPTSKRVEYFQLSKNEKMKIKEHGEFIALPQLIEHGCVKIRPSRAIRGILVGSLKYIFSKTTRIQVKLTDEFIREMKERTAERAPVEDYIVEDDFVSTNDIATAFAWNFLSLLNERKNKKKEQRKTVILQYCNKLQKLWNFAEKLFR